MAVVRRFLGAVAVALALSQAPVALAQSEQDYLQQQEKQRQIQAETEQVVRRMTTMLRVMNFYGADKDAEAEVLAEIKGALTGLSKNQMAEVIRRLDEAAKAPDAKSADAAVVAAYANHRKVVDALRDLLHRYDAIKNLDQAADRLDKLAKQQLDSHLHVGQFLRDLAMLPRPNLNETERMLIRRRVRNPEVIVRGFADGQREIEVDANAIIKQVLALRDKLPGEQQERVRRMEKQASEFRLKEHLTQAVQKLKARGRRTDELRQANELQWQNAGHLHELARTLRLPADVLAAL
jgi:hypothetical protein